MSAPTMSELTPSWDDCQDDDAKLWAACWSHRHGGPDVCRFGDYLQRSFSAWLAGKDHGWLLLGVFPDQDSASKFLAAIGKYRVSGGTSQ